MKASRPPKFVGRNASKVRRSNDKVEPAAYMPPLGSIATASAASSPAPPRKVENATAPLVLSFAANASSPPFTKDWMDLTVGAVAPALPAITAFPLPSTTIAFADSSPSVPPKNVRYEIAEPDAFNLAAKASAVRVVERVADDPVKLVDRVRPATKAAPELSTAIPSAESSCS